MSELSTERAVPMSYLLPCQGMSAIAPVWRRAVAVAVLAALAVVLSGGCDYVAVTDEQLVKTRTREHAEAITASVSSRDWRVPASFYDANVTWQQGTTTLKGRDAAKGFLGSVNAIQGMDEFFIIVNSTATLKPDLIEAKVTFQAHIVISSTELNYSNRFWDGRMGWVKRGPGKWQILYIVETTERKDGKFSRI